MPEGIDPQEIDEIVASLSSIRERLDDLVLSALHEAVRTKQSGRPEIERQMSRARRYLDRTINELRGARPEEDDT